MEVVYPHIAICACQTFYGLAHVFGLIAAKLCHKLSNPRGLENNHGSRSPREQESVGHIQSALILHMHLYCKFCGVIITRVHAHCLASLPSPHSMLVQRCIVHMDGCIVMPQPAQLYSQLVFMLTVCSPPVRCTSDSYCIHQQVQSTPRGA